MTVGCVSDVALGYGTPQLPLLVSSICEHYKAPSVVIEPVQSECPPLHYRYPGFRIISLPTSAHPHSQTGRNEYLWRAMQVLNQLQPEILLICCTYTLPVIFGLNWRPRQVIYFSLESVSFYGGFDSHMNHHVRDLVDVVIFSEENRAMREVREFGFERQQKVVLYNCSNRSGNPRPVLPRDARNGRILYAGRIAPVTLCDYFGDPRIQSRPIDLHGPITFGGDEENAAFRSSLQGAIKYRGFIPAIELAGLRPSYIYSVVMWNPEWHREQHYYAAPNKLFEAIADGVPPLSAPHPQCDLLIRRYGCGVVMPDWSFAGFEQSVRRAMDIWKSGEWDELVQGCHRAVQEELNWEAQFSKLRHVLAR
ncbi:MAG: glycosyltransferase [Bryobacteraceae bacterium]